MVVIISATCLFLLHVATLCRGEPHGVPAESNRSVIRAAAGSDSKNIVPRWANMLAGALDKAIERLDIGLPDASNTWELWEQPGYSMFTKGNIEPTLNMKLDRFSYTVKPDSNNVTVRISFRIPQIVYGYRFMYTYGTHNVRGNLVMKLLDQQLDLYFEAQDDAHLRCQMRPTSLEINFNVLDKKNPNNIFASFLNTEDDNFHNKEATSAARKTINTLMTDNRMLNIVKSTLYDVVVRVLKDAIVVSSDAFHEKLKLKICQVIVGLLDEQRDPQNNVPPITYAPSITPME